MGSPDFSRQPPPRTHTHTTHGMLLSPVSSQPSMHSPVANLYSTPTERSRVEREADLFSIIRATELLERAYVRDAVSAQDYTAACAKLIGQFKTAQLALPDLDMRQFIVQSRLSDCAAAS